MVDCVTRIMQKMNKFTYSQKIIANYIIENLEVIAFNTLENLSANIGVSTTTIVRFSRSIGYDGYSNLQKDIQSSIIAKASLPERLNQIADKQKNNLLSDSFANDIKNIQETLTYLSEDSLREALAAISSARNVYILGMRSSFSLAFYMASRLGQIRDNIRLIQSVGMLFPEEIVGAGNGDVCITYFFPRYSKSSAVILSWLKKHGVKVILFTSMHAATVKVYGDIILPCSVNGILLKNSYAAPLCLNNYIIAELSCRDIGRSKEVLERTEEILNQGYYLGL